MIDVDEALGIILNHVHPLPAVPRETTSALGLVTGEETLAPTDLPGFDNSAMDGYAVRAADTIGASDDEPVRLRITQTIPAGAWPSAAVGVGEAARILTGAPLPTGADAVVIQETVTVRDDLMELRRPVEPGRHIRRQGEDLRRGAVAVERGRMIRPVEIGLLVALGVTRLSVIPRPRVAILATGDELVASGGALAPGKIFDSNAHTLVAEVLAAGGEPIPLGIARDSVEDTRARIVDGLPADLLVISGGVSVGDRDCVKEALASLGMETLFWRVRMRPGKPLLFGLLDSRPVLGLPGNPAASLMAFEHFALPAIYRLRGLAQAPYHRLRAVLEEDLPARKGSTSFIRVSLRRDGEQLLALPSGSQSGGIMSSLAHSDGTVVVAFSADAPRAGETVEVRVAPDRVI